MAAATTHAYTRTRYCYYCHCHCFPRSYAIVSFKTEAARDAALAGLAGKTVECAEEGGVNVQTAVHKPKKSSRGGGARKRGAKVAVKLPLRKELPRYDVPNTVVVTHLARSASKADVLAVFEDCGEIVKSDAHRFGRVVIEFADEAGFQAALAKDGTELADVSQGMVVRQYKRPSDEDLAAANAEYKAAVAAAKAEAAAAAGDAGAAAAGAGEAPKKKGRKSKSRSNANNRVRIAGVTEGITEDAVQSACAHFGDVKKVKLFLDAKPAAIVTFKNEEAASEAVKSKEVTIADAQFAVSPLPARFGRGRAAAPVVAAH